jgi:hypothetical protein
MEEKGPSRTIRAAEEQDSESQEHHDEARSRPKTCTDQANETRSSQHHYRYIRWDVG